MRVRQLIIYFLIALSVFLLMLMSGCKTKYVTVPEYHTEYVVRTDTVERTDSIYRTDSVVIFQRGDTIFKDRLIYQDRYRYRNQVKTDTLIKRDTIYVPKPTERTLTKWEQRYISLGKYSLGAIVSAISVIIAFAVWRWHRKKG